MEALDGDRERLCELYSVLGEDRTDISRVGGQKGKGARLFLEELFLSILGYFQMSKSLFQGALLKVQTCLKRKRVK